MLSHPRVVRVLDYFQDETGQYLVMELVEGTDLGVVLKQRGNPGLPLDEAIEYVRQACEALQYVHEQQIIHRDVKPQNLILGENGVVLVDFGDRAPARRGGDQGTVGIGTPRFMAPEVFAGGTVSPRSDVFGLAATLWTLIAGKPPVYADPTRLSSLVREVPPELEQTIMAGLEMIPERRVASVGAFAKALGAPLVRAGRVARAVRRAAGAPRRPDGGHRPHGGRACSGPPRPRSRCIDRTTGELVYQSAWGAGAREIVGVRLPPGAGIAGIVVESGEPEAVADCRNDPRFAARIAEGTGYVPYTMLVVPLKRDATSRSASLSLLDRRDGGPLRAGRHGARDAVRRAGGHGAGRRARAR